MDSVQAPRAAPTTSGATWDRLEADRLVRVPVLAAAEAAAWVTAGAGGIVLILEGLQQLGQFQHNWITYRSTCESLKHEKFPYLGRAGPYSDSARPEEALAERVEARVSQEHAAWALDRKEAGKPIGGEP